MPTLKELLDAYGKASAINATSGKFTGAVFLPCKKGQNVVYHVAPYDNNNTNVVDSAYFIPFLGQN